MPLSEHEQRQLKQIEQALYTEDPKFVHAVRSSDPRVHYKRRALQAVAGFVVGLGLLLGGVASPYLWIGVAGFIVMLVCSMWALTSWRHASGMSAAFGPSAAGPKAGRQRPQRGLPGPRGRRPDRPSRLGRVAGPGMMERFEERWRRRQEGG